MKKCFVCVNCPKFCQMNQSQMIVDKLAENLLEGYDEFEFKCKPGGLLQEMREMIEERLCGSAGSKSIRIYL